MHHAPFLIGFANAERQQRMRRLRLAHHGMLRREEDVDYIDLILRERPLVRGAELSTRLEVDLVAHAPVQG
jgi:hypothetical protein